MSLIASQAFAANSVRIEMRGGERCVMSNSTPNHAIGQFPNRGNPHRFRAQSMTICVDASPRDTGRITRKTNASGISLTGILFRPGTADFYDPGSRRGFSRNPASGWRLEGMGSADKLGMDHANGHVDNRGVYHYHAPSAALLKTIDGTLIGYAADGFEIHYIGKNAAPSWQLKQGTRPAGPRGRYDGTYEQDWEHVAGSGNLDECNGAMTNGRYVYFATDTFPFFPRCFKGRVSQDFLGRP
ncbi:MAG: YHYH protein [Pseudomonadota bacterium]